MLHKKICIGCGKTFFHRKIAVVYCSRRCGWNRLFGKRSKNYKTGKYKSNGYIRMLVKGHPDADEDGYVEEHRIVMEKKIGRYLTKNEIVHHINRIKDDNRIENLTLFSKHDHLHIHKLGNKNWLGKHHSEETKKKMSVSAIKAGTGTWIRKKYEII
jgi:hypothetical protein